jgi:hypothetical protein
MISDLKARDSVAVVGYKPPQKISEKKILSQFPNLFLSHYDHLEVMITVILKMAKAQFTTEQGRFVFSDPDMIVFVIDNLDEAPITLLEKQFDEKPGSIAKLVKKASQSKGRLAEKDRLSVQLLEFNAVVREQQSLNGMTFFELTERSHAVLNEVVAAYSRLQSRIEDQPDANEHMVKAIEKDKALALGILLNADNFSTVGQMQEIVDKYAPIAREFHRQTKDGFRIFAGQ